MLESLQSGLFSSDPQYGMLKAHHHPNGKHLDCFQPEDWYLNYFQPMGKNTTGELHYTKADATTQFCRDS